MYQSMYDSPVGLLQLLQTMASRCHMSYIPINI